MSITSTCMTGDGSDSYTEGLYSMSSAQVVISVSRMTEKLLTGL